MGGDQFDCGKDRLHGGDSGAARRRADERGPAAIVAQDRDRLKLLEREVKELRRANEIQRKASAYFARAELEGAR